MQRGNQMKEQLKNTLIAGFTPDKEKVLKPKEPRKTTKAKRIDAGQFRANDRDRYILRFANEQLAITVDQLRYLLAKTSEKKKDLKSETMVSMPTAIRYIKKLHEAGYILTERINNKLYILASAKAIKDFDLDYKYYEPTNWNHLAHIVEVRLQYEREGFTWICERELRKKYSRNEKFTQHFPDGEIVFENAKFAVEVELSVKTTARRKRILEVYGSQERLNKTLFGYKYEKVLYFVNQKTEGSTREAVKKSGLQIFEVIDFKEIKDYESNHAN